MLDLDKAGTPDPYVERLFGGVAFSMERLREKIDDDLPELTEGLVSMLWPHYLRTIPWLSVVALTPELPTMKMAETVLPGWRYIPARWGRKIPSAAPPAQSVGPREVPFIDKDRLDHAAWGYDFAHTGIVAQLGSPQMLDFYDNSVLPGLRVKQLLNLISAK